VARAHRGGIDDVREEEADELALLGHAPGPGRSKDAVSSTRRGVIPNERRQHGCAGDTNMAAPSVSDRSRAATMDLCVRRAHVASTWRSRRDPGAIRGPKDRRARRGCQGRTGSGVVGRNGIRSLRRREREVMSTTCGAMEGAQGEGRERPYAGTTSSRLADRCGPLSFWRARWDPNTLCQPSSWMGLRRSSSGCSRHELFRRNHASRRHSERDHIPDSDRIVGGVGSGRRPPGQRMSRRRGGEDEG
jgi:hypothetical protein